MRIVSIFIFGENGCSSVEDLTFLSFFNRKSVSEIMHELVHKAVESTEDVRKIFDQNPWRILILNFNQVKISMVTDEEYPTSVAFEIMHNLFHHPILLHKMLDECQDPRIISPLYRLRTDLDETLVIMHENVDKILQNGVDIDELIEKSSTLSEHSKTFYKAARQHNRCCSIS